ncbi:MAG: hypothetical protein AAF514_21630 [Verrucomicrobiota bacterium]
MKWLLLSLGLSIGAMALYFALSIGLGWQQRIPILPLLLMILALFMAFGSPTPGTGTKLLKGGVVVVECGLLALFAWWTLGYSSYQDDPEAAKKGTTLAATVGSEGLTDSFGQPFDLLKAASGSKGLLLVFYRGYW